MIAQRDGTDWIIATASKCSSSRLRTALTQEAQRRPSCPVAEYLNPWQGGRVTDVPEYDLRIFVAREPLERWNSLYWYFVNVREKPPMSAEALETFPRFMAAIARGDCGHYDCTPLTKHLRQWRPHFTVLLRDVDLLWELIDAPPLWRHYYYRRSSRHATPDKPSAAETMRRHGPPPAEARELIRHERQALAAEGAFTNPVPSVAGPPPEDEIDE